MAYELLVASIIIIANIFIHDQIIRKTYSITTSLCMVNMNVGLNYLFNPLATPSCNEPTCPCGPEACKCPKGACTCGKAAASEGKKEQKILYKHYL